jgi:hypothetical protein
LLLGQFVLAAAQVFKKLFAVDRLNLTVFQVVITAVEQPETFFKLPLPFSASNLRALGVSAVKT